MVKYIIDSEVSEEIQEIINSEIINSNDLVSICCPTNIVQPEFEKYHLLTYELSSYRLLNKLKQLFFLIYLTLRFKPDVIFSGYPLLKHRVVSLLSFGKVKHYSYLRGLFADPNNYKGFSDALYLKFKKHPRLLKVSNFQCDKILTVSKINVDFLTARGVSPLSITLISPPWLKAIQERKAKNEGCNINSKIRGNVFFVTQAFSSHSFHEAASSQVTFALTLKKYLNSQSINLIIRKHPRDCTDYKNLGFQVNQDASYDFIYSLKNNDILISPFSTLAAEATFFSVKVIFYSTNELDKVYSNIYKKLKINPYYDAEAISKAIAAVEENGKFDANLKEIFFTKV